jgi:hypothetical protein
MAAADSPESKCASTSRCAAASAPEKPSIEPVWAEAAAAQARLAMAPMARPW